VDKITENLLAGFSKENGIEGLSEDTRFEHLAAFLTVRRHYSRALDSADLVTGAGGEPTIATSMQSHAIVFDHSLSLGHVDCIARLQ
jgi:hypothetical protein